MMLTARPNTHLQGSLEQKSGLLLVSKSDKPNKFQNSPPAEELGFLKRLVDEDEELQDGLKMVQRWPDGSLYNGSFKDGVRHGQGKAKWSNGEKYLGEFIGDKREGKGTYVWADGFRYEGFFKQDKRTGYGKLFYPNGNYFEGIYADDIRNGPGCFTYIKEDLQDIGIWMNKKIIKICHKLNNAFTFKNFLKHSINSGLKEIDDNTTSNKKKKKKKDKEITQFNWEVDEDIVFLAPESFQYKDIIMCLRENFRPKGPLEIMSEKLIYAASDGDVIVVEEILRQGNVHPDVTDRTGFGALLAAAVNCHLDVINCILDYGGNVNGLNDEGLSALAACHILLYTNQDFVDNTAENMPKESSFNSIEWDKQKGCFMHRNDRKTILQVYGNIRSGSGVSSRKSTRKVSQGSIPSSLVNGRIVQKYPDEESDHQINEEEENELIAVENWKLTYYQRTLSRSNELEEINEGFRNLRTKTFESEVIDNIRLPPLKFLKAEQVAKEFADGDNMEDTENGLDEDVDCQISAASIFGGDGSFGKAPVIEMSVEDTKQRLLNAERKPHLNATIKLMLERGADPNASSLPMPVLFFAVKSADTAAVKALLSKGADTSIRLSFKYLGLAPLHIAVSLPCPEGIEITRLLLEANADPDITDLAFGESDAGRTALHIACAREDCDKDAQKVVEYLLQFGANPDIICQGHSPLSLAITSGNDLVVDTLLKYKADPSLKLTNGVGSAMCAATTFAAERRRKPCDRVRLIDKLVKAGSDLLAPIVIMDKFPPGTVVDYAYHVFNQDRRIAHTPYHALSALERACHNTRKEVLEHLGNLLRTAALKREKEMLQNELNQIAEAESANESECLKDSKLEVTFESADSSRSQKKKPTAKNKKNNTLQKQEPRRDPNCGLPFAVVRSNDPKTIAALEMNAANQRRLEAKRRFRYCYECGRLIGIRLAACTRCKEVFYCSKNCKVKAWNLRHKDECARLSGRRSAGPVDGNRAVSPTPTTEAAPELPLLDVRSKNVEDFLDASSMRSNQTKTSNKLSVRRQVSASSKAGSAKSHSLSVRIADDKDSRRASKISTISKRSVVK